MKICIQKFDSDKFAARHAQAELHRYLGEQIGGRIQIVANDAPAELEIRLAVDADTGKTPDDFSIRSESVGATPVHCLTGTTPLALLYAAYRYLEEWGVRFYLHGDSLPTSETFRIPGPLDIKGSPVFAIRGLNTWGTHAFGIDRWGEADFRRVFAQMAKMRMNFFGLHTYPEGLNYANTNKTPDGDIIPAEPWVWIGEESMIRPDGSVTKAYPSGLYNTGVYRPWGDTHPVDPSSSPFGANTLFPDKYWSSEIMAPFAPLPEGDADCRALFDQTGRMLHRVFSWAQQLGIKTCIGTEAPLRVPREMRDEGPLTTAKLKSYYRGIFERIRRTHPLDYYWIWTPEDWTWDQFSEKHYQMVVDEIRLADEILTEMGRPFELATAGWVLGPEGDRTRLDSDIPKHIPVSALFRQTGLTPLDPSYRQIDGRSKWAIPWLESDGYKGMQAVQLEVGRTLYDAKDARDAGCDGLLGLHWRTHEIAPVASALARAAWGHGLDCPVLDHVPEQRDDFSFHPRSIDPSAFYEDYCVHQFGGAFGREIGQILADWDGNQIELLQYGCPTSILHDNLDVEPNIVRAFRPLVEIGRLRPGISNPVHTARLQYWLGLLDQEKALTETCFWLNLLKQRWPLIKGGRPGAEKCLEAYQRVLDSIGRAFTKLLESVDSHGGVAMVVNLIVNGRMLRWVLQRGEKLQTALREAGHGNLSILNLDREYRVTPRIKVWSPPTYWPADEEFSLNINVLSQIVVDRVEMVFVTEDAQERARIAAKSLGKGHWRATIPARAKSTGYRIESRLADGTMLTWPEDNPAAYIVSI